MPCRPLWSTRKFSMALCVLQVYGLDAQTDCMGHLTHADFDKQDAHPEHPKQYKPNEISAVLIR